MKFAICNETYQDWPLEKTFEHAREVGYTGIEFAPFTLGTDAMDVSESRRVEIRELLEKYQLESIGLHWLLAKTEGYYLTSPEAAVRERTSEYMRELARLCRDLNGSVMVLGSPLQRNLLPNVTLDQAMDYAAEVIRAALPALEDHQVTLALEPLGPAEGDFMLTAESGIQLAQMIDSPQVRLHLDVKAMSSEEKPIPNIIKDSREHLAHFHANDPNKRGPGMGDVDFVPIFQTLQEINYDGWVSVEVFDYEPGIEALTRDSLSYMQKCLKQLND